MILTNDQYLAILHLMNVAKKHYGACPDRGWDEAKPLKEAIDAAKKALE